MTAQRTLCLLLTLVMIAAGDLKATAQRLVTDISQEIVELRYDFAGTSLLLFGAISPPARKGAQVDLVIGISGPVRPMMVRRKAQIGGVWINRDSARVDAAPAYYALASTRPLAEITSSRTLAALSIGPGHLPFAVEGTPTPGEASAFRAGFVRNMEKKGLYRFGEGTVELREGTLFRTDIRLPATVPEGVYNGQVILFVDGMAATTRDIAINVEKTGLERMIHTLSRERPLIYGLMSVLIALLAGWGASLMSRK